ncbi:MAG: hypothetical protein ACRD18_09415 [Terriglobia bacterium]
MACFGLFLAYLWNASAIRLGAWRPDWRAPPEHQHPSILYIAARAAGKPPLAIGPYMEVDQVSPNALADQSTWFFALADQKDVAQSFAFKTLRFFTGPDKNTAEF